MLDEIKSVIGVSDAFSLWKAINQAKIDKAYSNSQNTIAELNASATLMRLNNQAVQSAEVNRGGALNPFAAGGDSGKMLGYALIGAAALASVYLLLKK